LPADYPFTAADNGVHTFSGVILRRAGSRYVTATDTVTGSITGSAAVNVVAAAASQFVVSTDAAAPDVAGTPFHVTVTAQYAYGNTATTYTGTVHFSSTDPQATLPADYPFTAADNGVHTFSGVVLRTTGNRSVTATDHVVTGSAPVSVVAAAASRFVVSTDAASPDVAGTPFDVTVTAQDAYGNTATGYTGRVHFSSTDPQATLPVDYPFTAADNGVHTFSGVVLRSAASQTLTAGNGGIGSVTEFPIPTANGNAHGITAGADGNLWFVEELGNKVGKVTPAGAVTEYTLPTANSQPYGITAGPDGNLWFTEGNGNKIGRITPAGAVTEFPVPTVGSNPYEITVGPDGDLWFTEKYGNMVGKITRSGVVTEFAIPTGNSSPAGITAGPDGNLWFTEESGNGVGRITPAGAVTEFPVPTGNSSPAGITAGPDGNLWFTELFGNKIGRITPAGAVTEFPVPTGGSSPTRITAGPDGNLWFTEESGNQVGRITPAGAVTEFPIPTANSQPDGITAGPDGNLWFTEVNGNQVGQITSGAPSGSTAVSVVAAAADHIAFSEPATVTAGVRFPITVTVQDAFNNTVTTYTGTVHFTATNGAHADYTFQPADQGQRTFNIAVYVAQTLGVTGTDTATGITGMTSFVITPAAADHLVFLQPPTDTAAGQTISPVSVAIVDQYGNVETGDNSDAVALSIGVDPSGGLATLSGTLTMAVVNGVATFGDLSIDMLGMGYTVHATVGGGVPDIDSDPFNII
jgi:streptogramin lyase